MADTVTPKLALVKPEIGASGNTWGNKTNSNWDIVDAKTVRQTAQWTVAPGDDTVGSSTGHWYLTRYGNDGLRVDDPIVVNRQTGDLTIADNLNVTKNLVVSGTFQFGATVLDANSMMQTGDMLSRYGTGARAGYVRLNGLTIGNAASSATERPNADCQALFKHLWDNDSTLVVSGGRGANALADFAANKQLTLPDWRGYAMTAMEDMGNTNAARNAGIITNVLGGAGGVANQSHTNTTAEMPSHAHPAGISDPSHTHGYSIYGGGTTGYQSGGSFAAPFGTTAATTGAAGTGVLVNGGPSGNNSTYLTGGGTPWSIPVVGPRKLCTFYIKL